MTHASGEVRCDLTARPVLDLTVERSVYSVRPISDWAGRGSCRAAFRTPFRTKLGDIREFVKFAFTKGID